ncbi:sulfatase-like hydrolase/transferase, partial [bacterium]|nr:sulfatase-like hydrolase/transferase [bacterium]
MTGEKAKQYGSVAFVDPKTPMVMSVLRKAGYRTGHFGKWHLGIGKEAPSPSEYGVDDHRTFASNGPGFEHQADMLSVRPRLIYDEAIRFIEENKDLPFYLNVWSVLPHAPLNPNAELVDDYGSSAGKNYRDRFGVQGPITVETFNASVKAVDTQVGRFMEKLDELGLSENTVVIISSDNGPEVLDVAPHASVGTTGPFRGRKRSLYEGGVRMPFIVRCPGKVPEGKVNDTSVLTGVDWLPTVCTLAGVRTPDTWLDGENVADIFLGSDRRRNRPIMWEWRSKVYGATIHRSPILSIRDGDWKLLMNPDESRIELYDIPNDPSEVDNVASENPRIVKRLKRKVLAFHHSLPPGPVQPEAGKKDYPWPREASAAEVMGQ